MSDDNSKIIPNDVKGFKDTFDDIVDKRKDEIAKTEANDDKEIKWVGGTGPADQQQAPEPEPPKEPVKCRDIVNCMNCGGTAFIKAAKLGPRPNPKAPPVVYEKIYVCAGCGSGYALDEFPIKGAKQPEKPKSAIIVPLSRNKLVTMRH